MGYLHVLGDYCEAIEDWTDEDESKKYGGRFMPVMFTSGSNMQFFKQVPAPRNSHMFSESPLKRTTHEETELMDTEQQFSYA
jgi:hypothetical protein